MGDFDNFMNETKPQTAGGFDSFMQNSAVPKERRGQTRAGQITGQEIDNLLNGEHGKKIRNFFGAIKKYEGGKPNLIVGGKQTFDPNGDHPNIVGLRTAQGASTAAGDYQITGTNWYKQGLKRRIGAKNFSPENQLKAAIMLFADRNNRAGLNALVSGDYATAEKVAALDWAALPSSQLHPKTFDQKKYENFIKQAGGDYAENTVQAKSYLPQAENVPRVEIGVGEPLADRYPTDDGKPPINSLPPITENWTAFPKTSETSNSDVPNTFSDFLSEEEKSDLKDLGNQQVGNTNFGADYPQSPAVSSPPTLPTDLISKPQNQTAILQKQPFKPTVVAATSDADYKTWLDYKNRFEGANLTDTHATRAKFHQDFADNENFGSNVEVEAKANAQNPTTVDNETVEAFKKQGAENQKTTLPPSVEAKNGAEILGGAAGRIAVDVAQKPVGMNAGSFLLNQALKKVAPQYDLTDEEIDSYTAVNNGSTAWDKISDDDFPAEVERQTAQKGDSFVNVNLTNQNINDILQRRNNKNLGEINPLLQTEIGLKENTLQGGVEKNSANLAEVRRFFNPTEQTREQLNLEKNRDPFSDGKEATDAEVSERYKRDTENREQAETDNEYWRENLGETGAKITGDVIGAGGRMFTALAGASRPFQMVGIDAPTKLFSNIAAQNESVHQAVNKDSGWGGKILDTAVSAPFDLSRLALLSRSGAVIGFAADSALQSAGRGENALQIGGETLKGAALGGSFGLAGKAGEIAGKISPVLTPIARIGAVGGATLTIETLSGTPIDEALQSTAMNVLFETVQTYGGKALNKTYRVWKGGKPTDIRVEENGGAVMVEPTDKIDAEIVADPKNKIYDEPIPKPSEPLEAKTSEKVGTKTAEPFNPIDKNGELAAMKERLTNENQIQKPPASMAESEILPKTEVLPSEKVENTVPKGDFDRFISESASVSETPVEQRFEVAKEKTAEKVEQLKPEKQTLEVGDRFKSGDDVFEVLPSGQYQNKDFYKVRNEATGETFERPLKQSDIAKLEKVGDETAIEPEAETVSRNGQAGAASLDLLTLGAGTTIKEDVVPNAKKIWRGLRETRDDIKKVLFAPSRGEQASYTAGVLRQSLAESARAYDRVNESLKSARNYFSKATPENNHKFIAAIEEGAIYKDNSSLSVEQQGMARSMRDILDEARMKVQSLGNGQLANFNRNYFPHVWKNAADVNFETGEVKGKSLEGAKSFLRERRIETFKDGIEAGLTPLSDNPVDLVLLKVREMNRYIAAHEAIKDLSKQGLVIKRPLGVNAPEGFTKINDKISQVWAKDKQGRNFVESNYFAVEPAAQIINNHLSPGLQGKFVFDAVRFAGNALNQFQLGFSAFHLGFTSMDAMISKFALGINQLAQARPIEAAKSFLTTPVAPITNIIRGDRVLKAWLDPKNADPVHQAVADLMVKAGGRAKMDDFYHTSMARKTADAFKRGNIIGGLVRSPFGLVDVMSKPLMEYIVPRQKLGVFADLMRSEMKRMGDDATPAQVREVAGRVWDSVDNRMGQLVYDNLFWNKAVKDLSMVSVRSVGWNLGSIREIVGGAKDTLTAPKRAFNVVKGEKNTNPVVTYRMAYSAAALPVVTGLTGAILNYLYTGEAPIELKDYFFPRTGELDDKGQPERVSLPTYVKDAYHIYARSHKKAMTDGAVVGTVKGIAQTAVGKANPIISLVAEMLENEDFFGTEIRNADDPMVQQMKDLALHVGDSFKPFGLRNYEKKGVSTKQKVGSFVGLAPAPADVNKTNAEELLSEIQSRRAPSGSKTKEESNRTQTISELAAAKRKGEDIKDEFDKAKAAGVLKVEDLRQILDKSSKDYLERGVKKLPLEDALKVYEAAGDEERKKIKIIVLEKVKNAFQDGKADEDVKKKVYDLGILSRK